MWPAEPFPAIPRALFSVAVVAVVVMSSIGPLPRSMVSVVTVGAVASVVGAVVGAVVCGGTSITCAWKQAESDGSDWLAHSKAAAERMKKNLTRYVTVL